MSRRTSHFYHQRHHYYFHWTVSFCKQLMAIVLCNNFKPHGQGTPKTKVLQLRPVCLTMGHEDIDVNLVYQFNGIFAVSVIFVVNSFEQRIALLIQILLRDEGVPAKYRLNDFLVCIAVYFHCRIDKYCVLSY